MNVNPEKTSWLKVSTRAGSGSVSLAGSVVMLVSKLLLSLSFSYKYNIAIIVV